MPELAGTITISPDSGVSIGTELTATYSGGTEPGLTYQWKKDGTDVATGATYTPAAEGSYTVTVSKSGYNPKITPPLRLLTPICQPWQALRKDHGDQCAYRC